MMLSPRSRRRVACLFPPTLLLVLAPGMARADQFLEVADGATIACRVSAHELTRFSLVGDQFASVSKIGTGTPYNDFAVSNEPVRGDIYVSVPETFAAARISFFATTKKGYVYKVSCPIAPIEAAQVFITNPAIAHDDAAHWEAESPPDQTAVRLIQAMAGNATLPGYTVRQASSPPTRVGHLEIQLIAQYQGAALEGRNVRIVNRGDKPVTLTSADLAPQGTLALAADTMDLAAGAATRAFVVSANGGDHP
ncbi:MAG: hypothetical protein RIS94_1383 [Pseudomonadota bacterium]|jgi:conjugal transfer pilus assembly protein TraK